MTKDETMFLEYRELYHSGNEELIRKNDNIKFIKVSLNLLMDSMMGFEYKYSNTMERNQWVKEAISLLRACKGICELNNNYHNSHAEYLFKKIRRVISVDNIGKIKFEGMKWWEI